MTKGKQGHFRSHHGYEMIRKASFKIRSEGAHMMSIASGRWTKLNAVMTMSSYPKEENTIKLGRRDSIADATNKSLSVLKKVFNSKCCFYNDVFSIFPESIQS